LLQVGSILFMRYPVRST